MKAYFWIIFGLLGFAQTVQGKGIVLTPELCQQVLPIVPGAEYVPGVDAEGHPVAPADLNATSILPDIIDIPITIRSPNTKTTGKYTDLLSGEIDVNTFTQPQKNSDQYVSDVPIGSIRWDRKSGGMSWNGKPLSGQWLSKIQRACKKVYPGIAQGSQSIIVNSGNR